MPLPEVQFHQYNYAPPGFQEEGISCRIRQGIGGPFHLEPGAEVEGHLHTDAENDPPKTGEEYFMEFKGESWLVKLTQVNLDQVKQNDSGYTGSAIYGRCIRQESD